MSAAARLRALFIGLTRPVTIRPAIAVHAGAGALSEDLRANADPSRAVLHAVLDEARAALEDGRDALSVAIGAVARMESFELFNAGVGSALCSDGTVQMSAALMRGSDRAAGAVAGVRTLEHPIRGARAVLEGDQVLLIGESAEQLGAGAGVGLRAPETFVTARQRSRLAQGADDHRGTVGAVVLDRDGVLVAGTSTGGITGQPPGRVGDSPLLGAGTWADQRVAISCTGDGEAFIRAGAAHRVAALVECGRPLEDAARGVLAEVGDLGGLGGLIALDADGEATLPFTTAAMPRGLWRAGDEQRVWIV